jgi:hypothetical protein
MKRQEQVELVKITTILHELLKPLGYKKQNANWLKNMPGFLIRVSYYSSQFALPGYIDVALTITPTPIERQAAGYWDAFARIVNILPSGDRIRELIKKEVSESDADILKTFFSTELLPLLASLENPKNFPTLLRIRRVNEYGVGIGWHDKTVFWDKLKESKLTH